MDGLCRDNVLSLMCNLCEGERYSKIPALTIDGYIVTCIMPRLVNGGEFFNFIVTEVVSQSLWWL
jgi:hypothetical protein